MTNWQYFPSKRGLAQTKYEIWRETAKGLISPRARLRLDWLIHYHTKSGRNATKTCRYFGIARKTFYIWLKRFDDTNLRSLEDGDHTPVTTRTPDYTNLEELRVIELRHNYPTAGRDKLVVLYRDDYTDEIKPWSMRRIIHDRKLYAIRAIRTKREKAQANVVRKKRLTELSLKPKTGFLIECDTV